MFSGSYSRVRDGCAYAPDSIRRRGVTIDAQDRTGTLGEPLFVPLPASATHFAFIILCRPGKKLRVHATVQPRFTRLQPRNTDLGGYAEKDNQRQRVFKLQAPIQYGTTDDRVSSDVKGLKQIREPHLRELLLLERLRARQPIVVVSIKHSKGEIIAKGTAQCRGSGAGGAQDEYP